MTQPAVTVKPGLVPLMVMISVAQKQGIVDIVHEDQTTVRAVIAEAIDEYLAKRRGTITVRQAAKLAAIEREQREEAARLGVPFERFLARLNATSEEP